MTKLTEHTVLARTRAQDLCSVRKLNAWGSELTDVSIVKRLPNVEVLSLSVNAISSLADFSHCHNLQELYIRKNNIAELGEIRYLKDLLNLKNLWLADNPCADCDHYRLTVIRALPQLQKLDNLSIRPDEIEAANVHGSPLELFEPDEGPVSPVPSQQPMTAQNFASFEEISSVTHTESFSVESTAFSPVNPHDSNENFHAVRNHVRQVEHSNHIPQPTISERYSQEVYPEREESFQYNNKPSQESSPVTAANFAANFQESYERESVYEQEPLPDTPSGSTPSKEHFSPKCGYAPPPYVQRMPHRSERPSAIRMLPKGGKSRAANILSAVLCLIKELDWASLEVVDTAIHCQMEELEEQNSS